MSASATASVVSVQPVPARRIIRLNTAIFYLAVVLFFVLLGAINYGSNAAYIVISLGTSTAIAGMVSAWHNMRGLRIQAGTARPAFAGEPLRGELILQTSSKECLSIICRVPGIPENTDVAVNQVTRLVEQRVTLVMPGRPRGVHRVSLVEAVSLFPMGLVEVGTTVSVDWEFVVYPSPLFSEGQQADRGDGQVIGHQLASTGDFYGHRAYVTGESQRRVDWRAVARERPLLVKQFATGVLEDEWIDFDHYADMPLEHRLSCLAGQIITKERTGNRYGLRMPGQTIAPGQGDQHYHACLSVLARWNLPT